MISVSEFIAGIERIAAREPTYRTGGVGKDGTCDCIGLIMGAMYELGRRKYDIHSSNYFARFQTMEMTKAGRHNLFIGQILYRTRTGQEKLNARYLPGGRYYTGDMLDYYHVGVVTGVKPLRIIECTEHNDVSGIVVSAAIKNWDCGGRLRDVSYDEEQETETEAMTAGSVPGKVLYRAEVATKEGALNVRERPETGAVLSRLPKGEMVEVLGDEGDGWLKIRRGGLIGYASASYLARMDEGMQEETDSGIAMPVTIVDSKGNRFQPVGDFRVIIGSLD